MRRGYSEAQVKKVLGENFLAFFARVEACKIPGSDARSILFGAEKGKKLELLEPDADLLTDDSRPFSMQMRPCPNRSSST